MAPIILKIKDDLKDKLSHNSADELSKTWRVCTKVKDSLENGSRLENISWRLWFAHNSNDQKQNNVVNTTHFKIPESFDFQKARQQRQQQKQQAAEFDDLFQGDIQLYLNTLDENSTCQQFDHLINASWPISYNTQPSSAQPNYSSCTTFDNNNNSNYFVDETALYVSSDTMTPIPHGTLHNKLYQQQTMNNINNNAIHDSNFTSNSSYMKSMTTPNSPHLRPLSTSNSYYMGSMTTPNSPHMRPLIVSNPSFTGSMTTPNSPQMRSFSDFNSAFIGSMTTPNSPHMRPVTNPSSPYMGSMTTPNSPFMKPSSPFKQMNEINVHHVIHQLEHIQQPIPQDFSLDQSNYFPSKSLPASRATSPKVKHKRSMCSSPSQGKDPICSNCNTTSTPLWRRSTNDELLCNACGLYLKLHNAPRPKYLKPQSSRKDLKEEEGFIQPLCSNCGTSTTPLWRRDLDGSSLCNACGLYLKLHHEKRPLSMKTDNIKKRQRCDTQKTTTKKTKLENNYSPFGFLDLK